MSLPWILPIGTRQQFGGIDSPVRILRGLGQGSQGQVFEVAVAEELLALKWYQPGFLDRDPGLAERLTESIRRGAPNADFLWPLALLRPPTGLPGKAGSGFGYLMPLRPSGFRGAVDHAAGRLTISLQNVLRSAFFLARGFHALHSRGLCYKDVSLGNLFLDADRGRILIGDNDNVEVSGRGGGAVVGTWGFMAPEVALGRARPDGGSDLFSLAVLLFHLLTRSDPFKGALERAIPCLDLPSRRRLYAEEPVFVFDPRDSRNRPDPIEHAGALLTWPLYPRAVQELFERSFAEGLHDPACRPLTGQWCQQLAACLDQRRLCPHCGEENLLDVRRAGLCRSCAAALPSPMRLRTAAGLVAVAAGNELQPHHLDPLVAEDLEQPLARVVAHPQRPQVLGLRNLSPHPWTLTAVGGEAITVSPGETANISQAITVLTPEGEITIERPNERPEEAGSPLLGA
jgi:DNA-binding helix-hairpin-helix protein with protein kinase domain